MTSVVGPSTHTIMAPLVIDQVKHLVILSFIPTYSIICYTIVCLTRVGSLNLTVAIAESSVYALTAFLARFLVYSD